MGARIRGRRTQLGMTQGELAAACGISGPSVSAWESGKTTAISGEYLVAAARALKVTAEWILTGEGPAAPLGQSQSQRPDRERLHTAIQMVDEVLAELGITYPSKQRADLVLGCYIALDEGQKAESARLFVKSFLEAQRVKT